mmetsp:Transcript_59389/g.140279  ORF Transcript_59389/g.140279 Transcript_59389/m.140279 type:complete len:1259 (-) Transcript_59389:615-4391(-)
MGRVGEGQRHVAGARGVQVLVDAAVGMHAVEAAHHVAVHHVDHRLGHRLVHPLMRGHAFLHEDLLPEAFGQPRGQALDVLGVAHRHHATAVAAHVALDDDEGLLVDAVFLVLAAHLGEVGVGGGLQRLQALLAVQVDALEHRRDQPGVHAQQLGKALGHFLVGPEMLALAPHAPAGVQRRQQVLLMQAHQLRRRAAGQVVVEQDGAGVEALERQAAALAHQRLDHQRVAVGHAQLGGRADAAVQRAEAHVQPGLGEHARQRREVLQIEAALRPAVGDDQQIARLRAELLDRRHGRLHGLRQHLRRQVVEAAGEEVGVHRRELEAGIAQVHAGIERRRVFHPFEPEPAFGGRHGFEDAGLQLVDRAGQGGDEVGNHRGRSGELAGILGSPPTPSAAPASGAASAKRKSRGLGSAPARHHVLGRHQGVQRFGPVHVIALGEVDTQLAQPCMQGRRADEFADGLHADHPRHVDKAAHRDLVQRIVQHIADELAVDLQQVDPQVLQIAEGRRTGAEIVQRHPDTEAPHLVDEVGSVRHMGHRRGLGDLEAQPGADLDAGPPQQLDQPALKSPVAHRLARQVDAEQRQPGGTAGRTDPGERAAQHPFVDAADQVEALRRRQEGAGRNQPALGIAHAQQHLGMQALGRAVQGFDALRVQHETVFIERLLDPVRPLHLAMSRAQLQVRVVPLVHPVAAGFLGGIAGGVRGLQDGLDAGPLGREVDQADAGADPKAPAIVQEAELFHVVADLLGHPLGPLGRAGFQQHREFIAAEPCDRVGSPYRLLQQAADLLEQFIAHAVAAGVIDELELVQVDVEQRMLVLELARMGQQAAQPRFELDPVDQPGQRIVAGAVGDFAGQAPLLGHIVEDQHRAEQFTGLVDDGGRAVLDAELLALARQQQGAACQTHDLAPPQALVDRAVDRLARVLMDDHEHLAHGQAAGLVAEPAGQAFGGRVQPHHAGRCIGSDDGIADGAQRDAQQAMLLGQFGRELAALGHIEVRAEGPQRTPLGVARLDAAMGHDPDPVAVPVTHPEFAGIAVAAPLDMGRHGRVGARQIFRMHQVAPGLMPTPLHLVERVADDLGPAGVVADLVGPQVPLPGAGAGGLQDVAQAGLLLHQFMFEPVGLEPPCRRGGQVGQYLALQRRQLPRLAVDHAQRADAVTATQHHRCAGVEADAGPGADQRVVGKTRVGRGIGHLEDRVVEDGAGAQGVLARRFVHRQADLGLEPLAVGVDQAEQRDRHAADDGRGLHQGIELLLGRGVQHRQ